ncbi:MAG TPA: 2-oxoglutarate dehydrogenase, E2 component, dihydrolipoamide succinyltransferase [Pseudolysinimonas sp.]|nr:2-oxoglutarate dehydrogenase, E2 component, dihydrolipoamide succinyltransferase [Pseudolysinimonas sp.]
MSESVSLPALGESVTEGTVTRRLKKVGDRVEVDEPLLEVSTDKVDTEIPSPVAGVIEAILVAEDETVEVGTALVTIGDGSGRGSAAPAPAAEAPAAEAPAAEAPAAEAPVPTPEQAQPAAPSTEQPVAAPATPEAAAQQAEPTQAAPAPSAPAPEAAPAPAAAPSPAPAPAPAVAEQPAPQAAPAPQADPTPASPPAAAPAAVAAPAPAAAASMSTAHAGYVTPIVRKLAHEKGVDLDTITGTGVGGRIRKQDVLAAVAGGTPVSSAPSSVATPAPQLETSALRGTSVPMSRLRKVVAERAVVSMQTMAQLTTVVEVDVTRVAAFRDEVKAAFQAKTGAKLNFLPFFTLAAAEALRAYPIINATIDGDNIVYPDHENISIAVDTERGLLTPVLRDAGDLNLAQIAQQVADLASRTRDNKLKPDELAGGTFTLTNTGSRGALFDTPVVFLPQVAILGTGIVQKKPVVVSDGGLDAIAIRSVVYLALSYDHRIVDGADAARFLTAVKDRLESGDFSKNLGI